MASHIIKLLVSMLVICLLNFLFTNLLVFLLIFHGHLAFLGEFYQVSISIKRLLSFLVFAYNYTVSLLKAFYESILNKPRTRSHEVTTAVYEFES